MLELCFVMRVEGKRMPAWEGSLYFVHETIHPAALTNSNGPLFHYLDLCFCDEGAGLHYSILNLVS